MKSFSLYVAAAIAEIAGCFAFWSWLKFGKSPFWAILGVAALILFAFLLARVDSVFAGRAFAAYGGIYISASLAWMWIVEGTQPDRWDALGAVTCILGAAIIMFGPRTF
jgi:small multidrug resistance family-3 protein